MIEVRYEFLEGCSCSMFPIDPSTGEPLSNGVAGASAFSRMVVPSPEQLAASISYREHIGPALAELISKLSLSPSGMETV